MKKIYKHLSRFKYLYFLIAFGVWMLFFDQNNFFNQMKLKTNLRNLEHQKRFYQQEIKNNQQLIERFQYDSLFMEQYAREKYLLKKDNEVIYLIVEEEKSK
ncbi:MAG TPA: septum formation initiator family protein [Bacteroidales bacterium]|nr:septum formation initiator family protein [Bacteroidales bacterium]